MEDILNVVMTTKEAVVLANEIERVESSLKLMKKNLQKFVDVNGEVHTSDKIWGYFESVSWKFDADSLKKVAEGMILDGRNPWELLNVTTANLKKLDWKDEVLEQYGGKRNTTSRFQGRKA
ncbi:hypothetical protein WMZ97_18780 [Lentibacillus sp. N15]|uniref:hypothetical protein n=1 Tax=Lentibacillus songyuanensis TaxID=3136161 RepID=UPI0031BB64FD